ncbi:MAG: 6-phosphofructokinase, partial [Candidatus Omnitrophica bacterium]|nr:6-phosphofructokinase [Candidatus Omnitrophota bacterium]
MSLKRIGVLTSGGEGSGMNAAVRSVVRTSLSNQCEIYGVYRGFAGLLNDEVEPLNHRSVSNIINRGGTILKTSRCPEFMSEEGQRRAVEILRHHDIEGL